MHLGEADVGEERRARRGADVAMNAEARAAICSSSSGRVRRLNSSTGVTGEPATPSQIFGTSAPDSANKGWAL